MLKIFAKLGATSTAQTFLPARGFSQFFTPSFRLFSQAFAQVPAKTIYGRFKVNVDGFVSKQ
jgi:hypothetical protein